MRCSSSYPIPLIQKLTKTPTFLVRWIIPVAVQAIVPVIVVVGAFLIRRLNMPILLNMKDWASCFIFLANAPRWLISKGRKDDAIRTLEKVRPKEDVGSFYSRSHFAPYPINCTKLAWRELTKGPIAAGSCKDEADAIQEALKTREDDGPWIDLFVGFPWTSSRNLELRCSRLANINLLSSAFRKEQIFVEPLLPHSFLFFNNSRDKALSLNVSF